MVSSKDNRLAQLPQMEFAHGDNLELNYFDLPDFHAMDVAHLQFASRFEV